jgi:CheY-like chemotaxis protein
VKEAVILLIEDDESDVFFFRRALSTCHFPGQVRVVPNAWQARNYLEGQGDYKDRTYYPLPQLIVCDLHLPGATGVEFVKWLRNDPKFAPLPLVIWSGSMPERQLREAVAAGASSVFRKTPEFARLCEGVKDMLNEISLPPETPS